MIIDIFFQIINFFLHAVAFVLPSWGLPDFMYAGVVYFGGFFVMICQALPVMKSIFISLSFILVFHAGLVLTNVTFGILALIRGSGQPKV